MSWDIVLLNSKQKINSIGEIDEHQLETTDFCAAFDECFVQIIRNKNHREIKGNGFSIDYFTDDEPVSNKLVSIYGESGLYELIILAKKYNWQIFDTGFGQMIDLENPSNNGYSDFKNYLRHITTQ